MLIVKDSMLNNIFDILLCLIHIGLYLIRDTKVFFVPDGHPFHFLFETSKTLSFFFFRIVSTHEYISKTILGFYKKRDIHYHLKSLKIRVHIVQVLKLFLRNKTFFFNKQNNLHMYNIKYIHRKTFSYNFLDFISDK